MTGKCYNCAGTGWLEIVAGEVELHDGKRITATAERPVYRRCKACQFERADPAQPQPRRYGD